MELVVPDDKLSLAIGKRGQNVRLASRLTGWRIDIHSESKIKQMESRARAEMAAIEGVGPELAAGPQAIADTGSRACKTPVDGSGKIKLEIPPEALAATLAPASEDVASSEAEDRA